MTHLRKKHRIFRTASESSSASDDPSDLPQEAPLVKGPLVTSSSKTVIEDLALGFVITSNQPFSVFQNPFLRQLLSTLNPSRLADTFSSKKKLIHLAFDLWTSPNRLAILAQRLLGLREQHGAHTGLNIASTLAEIASDWEIVDRIGCLVSDNASNNDICGERLFRQIQPDLSVDDANDRRIRCYGHILNLVGRAFLYGEDFESFEQESQAYDAMNRIDDDLRHWRKRGPVGKLHNLVRWATIKEGEDGSGIFLSEQSTLELQLLLNNETRWNSTFLMIERALRKQANIQTFLARNLDEIDPQKRIPVEDHLEMEDWRLLTELKEVLEPLYHQTMRTQGWAKQGGHGALWEILAGMEYLLEKMEDWKTFFDAPATPAISYRHRQRRQLSPALQALPDHIRAEYTNQPPQQRYESLSDDSRVYFRLSVLNGWKKLNEYYTK
ncbi:ribonuclease H-like domain-containing protein [Staphylotrichum tortipilum]|uniref:Ribonuclease H-like domain-containing protein n=1 Tax=Staphylotrichum tortipilum TaxID=2831512 RepID=A0AAN6M9E4_9PEZI|nr:ribonuclease H-like domain-containing protein [Staphylotrichum longicolle]